MGGSATWNSCKKIFELYLFTIFRPRFPVSPPRPTPRAGRETTQQPLTTEPNRKEPVGRWRWDRWEQSPLPLNTSEIPSWSEEQIEQPTVFQNIWRSETKDRGHRKIRRWDKKTWSAEKTRVRLCYTHKRQLKTSKHRRLRRQHHWIPLTFYHRSSYHKPRESEQINLRSRG